ncbi:MAG: hypothetical protein NC305_17810 [Lachnospiraceae bacterium]|nr:hypothetical protein [Butyrivibrio sp.]MCM1345171.1 hypothetical protein [Muribaculaceae bacterium]MCM1412377.1 hypothetical protein [Lachnospiraceae bacterium]MCM1543067.1 hypothetical protein [Blautia sp.]
MRITTQMLNESARKAGLPINGTSLLNYINGNSKSTLLDALNKNSTADAAAKTRYEKLEKTANQLSEAAYAFMAGGEDSLFSKARESGNSQNICNVAENLAGKYNSVLSALKTAAGPLNDYYRQMLKSAFSDNAQALEGIGISAAKDGTLRVDRDKLNGTDIDTLEKVFGDATDFVQKTAYVSGRIADNAQATQSSLSSRYSSAGSLYSSLASKYDLFG